MPKEVLEDIPPVREHGRNQERRGTCGMDPERLKKQIDFVIEIDRLKGIVRQTLLANGSRQEDSAEHSWHLAVMAMVLSDYANTRDIDLFRVLKMILVHDLVEIDAGDTYCYDVAANEHKIEREKLAADRIFSVLPDDQAAELRSLWEEFELRRTPEAMFAAALDRLQPLLNNYRTNGRMWLKHRIGSRQVFERNRTIDEGASALWKYAAAMIHDATERGWLIAE
jgi:putative hydrolase of HD superfamily